MRYSASDKCEIIQLVQNSDLSVKQTLKRLAIHRPTFCNWFKRYEQKGIDGFRRQQTITKRSGIKSRKYIVMPLLTWHWIN